MMTEKRFVLYKHKGNYYILENPRLDLDFIEMLGDALTSEEIVDELNKLNDKVVELEEENEQLIQKKCLPCELVNLQTRKIDKLKDENKQLKQEVDFYKYFQKDARELEKENEQLKIVNLRLQQRIDDLENKKRPMRWSE